MSHKADSTAGQVIAALKAAGWAVEAIQGVAHRWGSKPGVPDLLCAKEGRGMLLMEVKAAKGKLSPAQERWHQLWPVPVFVVRSAQEALIAVGAL